MKVTANIFLVALILTICSLNNSHAESTFANQTIRAITVHNYTKEWLDFKKKFEKHYDNITEKTKFLNFLLKLANIEEHNAKYKNGQVHYELKLNQFADYNENELYALTNEMDNSVDLTNLMASTANETDNWSRFKEKFDKHYDKTEETLRHYVFSLKLKYIEEHNAKYNSGQVPHLLQINQFADLNEIELYAVINGVKDPVNDLQIDSETFRPPANFVAPANVDWRKLDMIPPIKEQKSCGSCWTFAAIGAVEAHLRIYRNTTISLSEQNLVDCVTAAGGCHGGWVDRAFRYILDNGGIATEESYPYEAVTGECRYNSTKRGAVLKGFEKIQKYNEEDLKVAVASQGPVAVAIAVDKSFMKFKNSSIYDNPDCGTDLSHDVVIVGYGTENGQDYWLVRNSWGTEWGDQGYIKMARNRDNQCGIATRAIFPKV